MEQGQLASGQMFGTSPEALEAHDAASNTAAVSARRVSVLDGENGSRRRSGLVGTSPRLATFDVRITRDPTLGNGWRLQTPFGGRTAGGE
jgi:hypothetical protein